MESSPAIRGVDDGTKAQVLAHQLARWISILGHPFVLLLLYALAAALQALPLASALGVTAVVFVVVVMPLWVYLGRLVQAGRSNFDVSVREQRGPLYLFGFGLGCALVAVFALLGAPRGTFLALGTGLAMVATTSWVNRRLKVSLHSAFAGWTAVGFVGLDPRWLLPAIAMAVAVAVSRLVLRRHTGSEVALGLVLGALFAAPVLIFG